MRASLAATGANPKQAASLLLPPLLLSRSLGVAALKGLAKMLLGVEAAAFKPLVACSPDRPCMESREPADRAPNAAALSPEEAEAEEEEEEDVGIPVREGAPLGTAVAYGLGRLPGLCL
jgi:hypothetical protein